MYRFELEFYCIILNDHDIFFKKKLKCNIQKLFLFQNDHTKRNDKSCFNFFTSCQHHNCHILVPNREIHSSFQYLWEHQYWNIGLFRNQSSMENN